MRHLSLYICSLEYALITWVATSSNKKINQIKNNVVNSNDCFDFKQNILYFSSFSTEEDIQCI